MFDKSTQLLKDIWIFEKAIAYIRERKGNIEAIENVELNIQCWKNELRQSDSLYVTNSDGTIELVDDIGEIK